ncbi:MAG: hypothetical protein ACKVZJ_03520 [Phycisphaerales bacterium]
MKTTTKTLAAVGALALIAGSASAGRLDGGDGRSGFFVPISWEITHNFGSTSQVKSLLITVNDPFTGEVNPQVFILSDPTPSVTINTAGGLPRVVENTELLNLPGGGMAVRWTFADTNLWVQDEKLVFNFTADFIRPNVAFLIGEDYTFVPTPGTAALLAGAGLMGASRRRR